MKTFTVWTDKEGSKEATALIEGELSPRFADGRVDPDCTVLLFRIEAQTWDEARAIYNLRLGLEPYEPTGDAEPCPKCGALFYPKGRGECWKCGYDKYVS